MKKKHLLLTAAILMFNSTILILNCTAQIKELWGMTSGGGQYGAGAIFKTDASGNNQTLQQSFFQIEGVYPSYSELVQASDGMLYGMTYQGGTNNFGVLFQFDPATSTYTKILDFAGATNGRNPYGSLMQASDGMLYGMTSAGGSNGKGVLFQFDPVTSTYTKKIDFDGATNGSTPRGSLIQASDGKLYGMTCGGGTNNFGVLFQFDPATSTFTKKIDFAGATNGKIPYGSLMQASDGKLYGMSNQGGTANLGVLFQFDPVTTVYTKKIDFAGATNGSYPYGNLMQASDGSLYGMTSYGGTNSMGVLFQFYPATSTLTKKIDFDGTNGSTPYGSLMQASDGNLYGMTCSDGTNGFGVLFQFDPATSTYTKILDFAGATNGRNPYGSLMQASDGKLYGMAFQGGLGLNGVLFQFDPATSTFTKKIDFSKAINGRSPYGSLMQALDGTLYGMTYWGGTNGSGVLFQFDPATSSFTKKIDFAGATNGRNTYGSLMQASDGKLYGMTSNGGTNDMGVLFQFDPATSTYTKKIDFNYGTNGRNPNGSLIQASDGELYGMANMGGTNNLGVLFQFDPATSTYTKKIDFTGVTNGSYPTGSLMQASNGKLYGMTQSGGTNGFGVLFQFDPTTSTLTKKIDFVGAANGSSPNGSLMQASDGKLYGMTQVGGTNGLGVLFQFDPITSTYTKKNDFAGATSGSQPYGDLMQASDGKLCGMTSTGGTNDMGVLFQYDPTTSTYTKTLDFAGTTNGKNPRGSLIEINATITDIKDLTAQNQFVVFPNPFTFQTNILFNEVQKNTTLKIMDVLGKEIKTINFTGKQLCIERSEMKAGIYFVQVIDENNNVINKKIIVNK